ncbi:MAG: GntR family transcriptional regulator [Chloroflexi bacterium]|nr:GntR family transcriptional regulator [Chloroflexota bacterium]
MELRLAGNGPIYQQIVEQVRLAVATGRLAPGARLPTVRALAAELGVNANTVSRAYLELEQAGVLVNRPGRGSFVAPNGQLTGERKARLQAVLGRCVLEALSLGYSAAEIEAAFGLGMARWRQDALMEDGATGRGGDALREGKRGKGEEGKPELRPFPFDPFPPTKSVAPSPAGGLRLAGSHDLVLDLLAARLARESPAIRLEVTTGGSLAGLIALARSEAHLAGCHLLDADTGEYNLPFIRRLLPGRSVVVVQLAARQQGLIVPRGNPRALTGLADLSRPDIVFVNRQAGSGTRLLLDYQLARAGLGHESVRGYEREEGTHLRVAAAVAEGEADAGLGILAAARAFELDFLPLWQERYDLVIPREHRWSPSIVRLLDTLRDPDFRGVVQELGGYAVGAMGEEVS